MKLLIDCNIILDVLQNRQSFVESSSAIWKLCETGQIQGYVSVLTFANIVYIMRKELDPKTIEDTLQKLSLIFKFVDLEVIDAVRATELRWNDFEDAIQSVTTDRLNVDFIITRNVRDFAKSKVVALMPSELLARI